MVYDKNKLTFPVSLKKLRLLFMCSNVRPDNNQRIKKNRSLWSCQLPETPNAADKQIGHTSEYCPLGINPEATFLLLTKTNSNEYLSFTGITYVSHNSTVALAVDQI